MTEPTAANLRALEKTVYAYEKSIADIENGVPVNEVMKRWEDFGSVRHCKLCLAVGYNGRFDPKCKDCILGLAPGLCAGGKMKDSYDRLHDKIYKKNKRSFLLALRARLKAILRRVDERGYELTVIK